MKLFVWDLPSRSQIIHFADSLESAIAQERLFQLAHRNKVGVFAGQVLVAPPQVFDIPARISLREGLLFAFGRSSPTAQGGALPPPPVPPPIDIVEHQQATMKKLHQYAKERQQQILPDVVDPLVDENLSPFSPLEPPDLSDLSHLFKD